MLRFTRSSQSGFTLIELAIVLAVASLLFVGLWRLLSGGNTQLRDEGAASQQQQLISAVKGYLASSYGQQYMTTDTVAGGCAGCGPNANFALPLPTSTACTTYTDTNWRQFCNFLPSGFLTTTTNSYGQTYSIRILRDGTAAGTAPSTYSFMIMASGGDIIPDTSGGRISALIGNDGGFIYSTNVCNTQTGASTANSACGAYGAWAASVVTYGLTGASGSIASRTYVSAEQSSQYPWLARQFMSGDTAATPTYNTMTTPFFAGGQSVYLGSNSGLLTGGGTFFMQGGTISGTGLSILALTGDSSTNNPLINVTNAATCTMTAPSTPGSCPYAIQATTIDVTNLLNASALYAGTFIYGTGGGSSDIRLKKNIRPVRNALDNVMRLNPVSFTLKEGDVKSMGVVAQDIEKVYPDLVINGADGMKAVNYNGLTAPLIGAVQDLKRENDDLRKLIAEQAAREERLERELDSLKAAP